MAEIGWYIYGNTFVYTEGSQYCQGQNDDYVDAFPLWVSTLVIICWGYCLMIYLLGIVIFGVGLCCVYRSWNMDVLQKIGMEHGGERGG